MLVSTLRLFPSFSWLCMELLYGQCCKYFARQLYERAFLSLVEFLDLSVLLAWRPYRMLTNDSSLMWRTSKHGSLAFYFPLAFVSSRHGKYRVVNENSAVNRNGYPHRLTRSISTIFRPKLYSRPRPIDSPEFCFLTER